MASIPNLKTFQTGRRGHALRGGRSGRAGPHDHDGDVRSVEAGRDAIIQQTDHDASSSRMSAVALGYLDDRFAKAFLAPGEQITKRYPIIHRGTYVRTTAIDKLVNRFLAAQPEQRKQVVSLGAGSDTRFFRLMADEQGGSPKSKVTYHELDFEANANQKRSILRQSTELSECLRRAEQDGSFYHLHAIDLRDLTNKSPPIIPELNPALPTLLLSECCLCYLPPDAAASVLQYFTMNLPESLALILYEPIRPFDAFGKTMVSNLASRGIHLQTLKRYSSLQAQRQRLRLAGFSGGQGARDVHQLYGHDEWVLQGERERIEKLEWLDEVEEWKLLASHYCVAWGCRGELFGEAWQGIDGSRTGEEDQDELR